MDLDGDDAAASDFTSAAVHFGTPTHSTEARASAGRATSSSDLRAAVDANHQGFADAIAGLRRDGGHLDAAQFRQRFDAIHESIEEALARHDPAGSGSIGLDEHGYNRAMQALAGLHGERADAGAVESGFPPIGAREIEVNRSIRSIVREGRGGADTEPLIRREVARLELGTAGTQQIRHAVARVRANDDDPTDSIGREDAVLRALNAVDQGSDPEEVGRDIHDPDAFDLLTSRAAERDRGADEPQADPQTWDDALTRVWQGDDPRDVAGDLDIRNSGDRLRLDQTARAREAISDIEEGYTADPEDAIYEHGVTHQALIDEVLQARRIFDSDSEGTPEA